MYLCLCKGLTESDVDRCLGAGSCAAEALIGALGLDEAGTCGRCPREIRQCGPAAWRGGEPALVQATAPSISLIDLALTAAHPSAAERPPACGLAACGSSLCAACASLSIAASGSAASLTR